MQGSPYMSKLYKLKFTIATTFSIFLFSPLSAYSDTVYTWKENGVTVLSNSKPANTQDYDVLNVKKPTTVKSPNIDTTQLSAIAKSAEDQIQTATPINNQSTQYTIISPQNDENIFNHNAIIAIETTPSLTASDKPIVHINGSTVPLVFQNGTWTINRPNPGENNIYISGSTKDGAQIKSNTVKFYVHTLANRAQG